jgi:hypothetical protein
MAEDHLAAPAPLEEHRKLAAFVGAALSCEMAYPLSPSSGDKGGRTQIPVRGSLRSSAGHVFEIVDDKNHTMRIQSSPDAEGWADRLAGVARRLH